MGFIAETSPAGRSGSIISSLVVRHDQCALSYGGSGGGRMSCSLGGLDILNCISTNQHAWLDETYRPRLEPIGRYQRVCPATCDMQFQDPGEPKTETVKIIRIRCILQNK